MAGYDSVKMTELVSAKVSDGALVLEFQNGRAVKIYAVNGKLVSQVS